MVTNDERREVAARLRNFEQLRGVFRESNVCAFCDVLGVGYMDWEHICARLADLIDRGECENVYDGSVQDSCDNGFLCSVCGCKVEDEEHYRVSGVWNFCPECGRRVRTKNE